MAVVRGAHLGFLLLCSVPGVATAQAVAQIRDNSFLIEEAYNQDRYVVQHIGVFTTSSHEGWAFKVTDEWPLGGLRDQLSVGTTLVETGAGAKFGDVALNYRRQMIGHPDAAVVVSPRLSLGAVFGDSTEGGVAVQANIPVTAVLSDALVSHWNLGTTVGVGPALLNAGASVVWLTSPWVNFLVEGVFLGAVGQRPGYVISPGVRGAFNLGSVQVVPGFAVPINLGDRSGNELLFYLSFEHPFGPTD